MTSAENSNVLAESATATWKCCSRFLFFDEKGTVLAASFPVSAGNVAFGDFKRVTMHA
jgi:hypothetical protein